VVRKVCDLEPDVMANAAMISSTGPQLRVRLLAASERPVTELLRTCPFLDRLGTRLVLQTASEEDSVALLGTVGATAAFDLRLNAPQGSAGMRFAPGGPPPPNAIALVDGVILLRSELTDAWDFTVFVEVDFEEALRRACLRDESLFGSAAAVRERYERRYFPAQHKLDQMPADCRHASVEHAFRIICSNVR
jgi:hypothetical protein